MSNLTQDKNFLQPTSWSMTINSTQFANSSYFCTSVNIPGITLPEVAMPFRGAQSWLPGDRIDFPPLDIGFIVSENMENYIELYDWILECKRRDKPVTYDVELAVLTSANIVNKVVRFYDAFPTSISGINFSTQSTDTEFVNADASFRFTYFDFLKKSPLLGAPDTI